MSRDVNSLNKVILIGRVGRAPETRVLAQQQSKVVRFSVATNEQSFNPSTRETKDYTQWHNIVVWGKQTDFAEKYISQGRLLMVEGRLRTRKWNDQSGNPRTTTEVIAENIVLLGRREEPGAGTEAPEPEARPATGVQPEYDFPPAEEPGSGEDDIPF